MSKKTAEESFSSGNYGRAEKLFRERAISGEPEAWLFVAHCHGLLGNLEEELQAVAALEQAAIAGNAQAAFAMHLHLRSGGDYSEASIARSRRFLRLAVDLGNVTAEVQLAHDFRTGRESGAEDFEGFRSWMESASRKGHPAAIRGLFEELHRRALEIPDWLSTEVELLPEHEKPNLQGDA